MSSKPDLIVSSERVVTPKGERAADLVIKGGKIAEILPRGKAGKPDVDAGKKAILPALVDTHVHVNEPGRTEWEGFETATASAAAGGIGTIVEMPLNSDPVTTTLEAFKVKLAAAKDKARVNLGFWGGVVPGNVTQLEPMLDAGVIGFKAFLCHSGIDDFPASDERTLRESMWVLARRGAPLLAHAELDHGAKAPKASRKYKDYVASRPQKWECDAIQMLLDLCRETNCRVHVVHLSAASALPLIAQARKEKLPLTAETCPHYLTLEAESVPEGRTEFKCAPPIREKANREKLWKALKDGLIDLVVSDHSPCVPELKKLKEGDFSSAWGGISSLQLGLPVIWTEARKRKLTLSDLVRWMAENPARFAGLESKGALAPGKDADFTLFDADAEWTIQASDILHRHKLTPYLGRKVTGKVDSLYLSGRKNGRGTLLLNQDRRLAQ
jgi:allantoinase